MYGALYDGNPASRVMSRFIGVSVIFISVIMTATLMNQRKRNGPKGVTRIPNRSDRPVGLLSYLDQTATPSDRPTSSPSIRPTLLPSSQVVEPSQAPTKGPTRRPTSEPTLAMVETEATVTKFLAIGDVPYDSTQVRGLRQQIANLQDAAFMVHVGDIRAGKNITRCLWEDYSLVDSILNKSHVPILMVPGDNEWNDCANVNEGWNMWTQHFLNYQDRYWKNSHGLIIRTQEGRPENWYFVLNGSLFIGLNIVGGRVHNRSEWTTRLSSQANWTMDLIRQHWLPTTIFGHATPTSSHSAFFLRMQAFIRDELKNALPIFYLNGDKHQWELNHTFLGQPNWMRITLPGGVSELPLEVTVNASRGQTRGAFLFNRQTAA